MCHGIYLTRNVCSNGTNSEVEKHPNSVVKNIPTDLNGASHRKTAVRINTLKLLSGMPCTWGWIGEFERNTLPMLINVTLIIKHCAPVDHYWLCVRSQPKSG